MDEYGEYLHTHRNKQKQTNTDFQMEDPRETETNKDSETEKGCRLSIQSYAGDSCQLRWPHLWLGYESLLVLFKFAAIAD